MIKSNYEQSIKTPAVEAQSLSKPKNIAHIKRKKIIQKTDLRNERLNMIISPINYTVSN